MHWTEMISRLTGISCPLFGISWTPPEPDVSIAQRVIGFLEDRRVLYNPYAWEQLDDCISSVLKIRDYLTEELSQMSGEKAEVLNRKRSLVDFWS